MPFIAITHPPKYPLTEKEETWLTDREWMLAVMGSYSCGPCQYRDKDDLLCIFRKCPKFEPNYEDAAEFEARVAASIAQDAYNCAQDEMLLQHQEGDKPQGWYILRDARLAVEEEMQ
jgi:hypothetical protein